MCCDWLKSHVLSEYKTQKTMFYCFSSGFLEVNLEFAKTDNLFYGGNPDELLTQLAENVEETLNSDKKEEKRIILFVVFVLNRKCMCTKKSCFNSNWECVF